MYGKHFSNKEVLRRLDRAINYLKRRKSKKGNKLKRERRQGKVKRSRVSDDEISERFNQLLNNIDALVKVRSPKAYDKEESKNLLMQKTH